MINTSFIHLFTCIVLLLLPGISIADNKVFTLENSSDYGIVLNECEWIVSKGTATVDYHNRDKSAIKGESMCYPMEFEFFSLFIPTTFTFAKNYLNKYAFDTTTVFYLGSIIEGHDSIMVRGTFLDNMSSGYFELYFVLDRKLNGRAFGIMSKLRFDTVCEDKRRELFAKVASMITPLVN